VGDGPPKKVKNCSHEKNPKSPSKPFKKPGTLAQSTGLAGTPRVQKV